jgi:toxoflavin biosynthesis protein ToxC
MNALQNHFGHRAPISGISAFRDQYVATAGYDNQVILWDAGAKRPLARVCHDHLANQCAFSADGTRLVTSSSDYSARLWSVPDMRLLAVMNHHRDDVEMSTFHPRLELIATASRDHDVRVFDFSGRLLTCLSGHTADVLSVEWVDGGTDLITSSDDGTVKRWSMQTNGLVEDINLGGVETDAIVIGRDMTVFAGNDAGEIITICNGTNTATRAHDAGIKRLAMGPDGRLLISLSYDRTMRLWNLDADRPRLLGEADLPADVWPRSCVFAGDTLVFGTFGTSYRTYDYRHRKWLDEAICPTGGVNAVHVHDGETVTVGDAGDVMYDGRVKRNVGSLCNFFTIIGRTLLTGGQAGIVFNARTGQPVYQHRSPLNCGAGFIVDGTPHAVIGTYTGEGLVFKETRPGQVAFVEEVRLHENAVKGVAVSGDLIFSVCADSGAAWHRASTRQPVHRIAKAHGKIANGCAALGRGHFASVSRDLKLRLWAPDFTVTVVDTPHTHSIKCVACSEGRHVATGSYDGSVRIYDTLRQRWTVDIRPTTSGISSLTSCEADGTFLASSYDGCVYPVPASWS